MEMAWIYLIAACILEPIWVIFLDKSENFKKIGWAIATIVSVLSCLYLLSMAVIDIGPGVAYSILAGIGAIGTVVAGAVLYKDRITPQMAFFLALIIIGVIGIRLMSGSSYYEHGFHRQTPCCMGHHRIGRNIPNWMVHRT
jgi:quaternary ammonium compound-resistance protein SugE